MRYTEKKLFDFMDSEREVCVTCTDGQIFSGRCWAYCAVENEEEDGVFEPSLDVGPGTVLYISRIEKIEFID